MTEYELRREQIAASIDMAREALAKEKYKDVARLLETAHIIVSNELELEKRNEQRKESVAVCKYCSGFFSKYQCSSYLGECDCPKCLGYCECNELDGDTP